MQSLHRANPPKIPLFLKAALTQISRHQIKGKEKRLIENYVINYLFLCGRETSCDLIF